MTNTSQPQPEWPPRDQVNWNLLNELQQRPHPQLRDTTEAERRDLHYSVIEVLTEAKVAHHLLDLAGVPDGESYGADTQSIDCRTLIAIIGMGNLRERLDRISGWHARETGPAGTVGDFCTECDRRWPCDTRRMADGAWTDADDDAPAVAAVPGTSDSGEQDA